MAATDVERPFHYPDWVYEETVDGWRGDNRNGARRWPTPYAGASMARSRGVGRLYIVRFRLAVDPVNAEYLLTFGSPSTAEATLNLGSVHGLDGLTDVLRAGRVPVNEIEKAWRVLAVEYRHLIPNVTLTPALLQLLNT